METLAKLAVNASEDSDNTDIDQLTRQCQRLTNRSNGMLNGVLHSQSPVSQVPMVRLPTPVLEEDKKEKKKKERDIVIQSKG